MDEASCFYEELKMVSTDALDFEVFLHSLEVLRTEVATNPSYVSSLLTVSDCVRMRRNPFVQAFGKSVKQWHS